MCILRTRFNPTIRLASVWVDAMENHLPAVTIKFIAAESSSAGIKVFGGSIEKHGLWGLSHPHKWRRAKRLDGDVQGTRALGGIQKIEIDSDDAIGARHKANSRIRVAHCP